MNIFLKMSIIIEYTRPSQSRALPSQNSSCCNIRSTREQTHARASAAELTVEENVQNDYEMDIDNENDDDSNKFFIDSKNDNEMDVLKKGKNQIDGNRSEIKAIYDNSFDEDTIFYETKGFVLSAVNEINKIYGTTVVQNSINTEIVEYTDEAIEMLQIINRINNIDKKLIKSITEISNVGNQPKKTKTSGSAPAPSSITAKALNQKIRDIYQEAYNDFFILKEILDLRDKLESKNFKLAQIYYFIGYSIRSINSLRENIGGGSINDEECQKQLTDLQSKLESLNKDLGIVSGKAYSNMNKLRSSFKKKKK